jgi:hypothetical protein
MSAEHVQSRSLDHSVTIPVITSRRLVSRFCSSDPLSLTSRPSRHPTLPCHPVLSPRLVALFQIRLGNIAGFMYRPAALVPACSNQGYERLALL